MVEWRDGPLRAPEYLRRGVVLRLSRSGRTLTYATSGHLEGILQVGDRAVPARRVDGDGNGRFADPDDLLRLDLDGDGRFDPFAEQFAIGPILAVSGKSYALDTDRRGDRFSLAPLTGTGTVEWRVSPAGQRVGVREFWALLIGRDGAVIALAGAEGRATAPVGEYRLDSLALTLSDPAGGEPWNYTFSTSGTPLTPAWHRLTAGSSVVIEPLRGLRMGVDLPGGRGTRPGDLISAVPTLTTADSLVINSCYRGAPGGFGGEDGPAAEIALIEGAGRTLATARSGFA